MTKSIIFSFFLIYYSQINAQDCGVERWKIKTLSDPDTLFINFSKVVNTSIHEQVALVRPSINRNSRHISERTVLELKCSIVGYKREAGDKDIHIILEDEETEETLVAELPSSRCSAINLTSRSKLFFELEKWFVTNIGYPTSNFVYLKKHIHVIITGIGYFDYVHGQIGMAPNGREIHPVLGITKRNTK